MAEPEIPTRFTKARHIWQHRQGAADPLEQPQNNSDPAPFLPALLAQDGHGLQSPPDHRGRRRGAGLPPGERELIATAVARRLGCFFTASIHARRAAAGLRRMREIEVLLEEGIPCPLTGRLGAEIAAAAALTSVPIDAGRQVFWKLEEEKLDDQEITDLILFAGYALWNSRLALAAGEARLELGETAP